MFPDTFFINKRDLIIDVKNSYRVYSTFADFKKSKLILINKTNIFYEKISLKTKNAIIKKFKVQEKDIFEIKTNLDEVENKGRVKIEQIDFNNFLEHLSENNLSQKIIKKPTNIKGVPVSILGIASINKGVTIIVSTDISLSTDILKSIIDDIDPIDNFYLKDNFPFLNSVTFLSKKFDKKNLKIKNKNDASLKHFKKTLSTIFDELTQMILKEVSQNRKTIKIEIGLKSKKESLRILNELVKTDYIKSSLINLNNIDNYYLLKKSLFDLIGKNTDNKDISFSISNVPLFEELFNAREFLKNIEDVYNKEEILTLRICEENSKGKKVYSKYCLF